MGQRRARLVGSQRRSAGRRRDSQEHKQASRRLKEISMSLCTQTRFAAALADPAVAVPPGLTAWNGLQPQRRFAVYRNNVVVGLTGAIASRFPA
ncbi:MAG: putative DNA-binding domain-containing protein, partial [Gemmobacter sp.]